MISTEGPLRWPQKSTEDVKALQANSNRQFNKDIRIIRCLN